MFFIYLFIILFSFLFIFYISFMFLFSSRILSFYWAQTRQGPLDLFFWLKARSTAGLNPSPRNTGRLLDCQAKQATQQACIGPITQAGLPFFRSSWLPNIPPPLTCPLACSIMHDAILHVLFSCTVNCRAILHVLFSCTVDRLCTMDCFADRKTKQRPLSYSPYRPSSLTSRLHGRTTARFSLHHPSPQHATAPHMTCRLASAQYDPYVHASSRRQPSPACYSPKIPCLQVPSPSHANTQQTASPSLVEAYSLYA